MNELQHLAKPKDGPAPRWFHVAVAASMIISAVSALVATLHTGRTMTALVQQNERLVRANSTPILEFGHANSRDDGSPNIEFVLRNVGTGPARIAWFQLTVDGRPMQHMSNVIDVLHPGLSDRPSVLVAPVGKHIFAAGARHSFFRWTKPAPGSSDQVSAWTRLDQARFSRISVEACYCSIFEECWTSKLNGEAPTISPACPKEQRTSL